MADTDGVAQEVLLSGFGRGRATRARLHRPTSAGELEQQAAELFAMGRRVIGRGLGRAYGDAAQLAGGDVLDATGASSLVKFDESTGVVRAEAGLSLDTLLRHSVPQGWFVPVTPGTRHVSLGGAVAADVHGKNHHRDGSFGRHVRRLRLVAPAGSGELSPDEEPELFWATVGGMGLTGVVSEVELQMLPIESAYVRVDTDRSADLEQVMALLAEADARYRYSVAWVDCLASGRSLGRSVLTCGDHASVAELDGARRDTPLAYAAKEVLSVPFAPPRSPLNGASGRLLNELWYRKAPRHREGEIEPLSTFFYPLDGIRDWNLAYGPHGFTQYQLVVPFGAERVARQVIEALQRARQPVLLAVLKRFGAADPAPLSFPEPGWTLALDLALGRPGLAAALDALDELVLGAGGRVYFAKDGRLAAEKVAAMYPRLGEWRRSADRLDPDHLLESDLSARLHLRADATMGAAS